MWYSELILKSCLYAEQRYRQRETWTFAIFFIWCVCKHSLDTEQESGRSINRKNRIKLCKMFWKQCRLIVINLGLRIQNEWILGDSIMKSTYTTWAGLLPFPFAYSLNLSLIRHIVLYTRWSIRFISEFKIINMSIVDLMEFNEINLEADELRELWICLLSHASSSLHF